MYKTINLIYALEGFWGVTEKSLRTTELSHRDEK